MIPSDLNLYIKQGANYALSVTLLQGEAIRLIADVQTGAVALLVEPIRDPIAKDRKLLFEDVLLTVGADTPIGAASIPIEATLLPISKKVKGYVCSDLTGCTARADIKGKLQTSASPQGLTPAFDSDRLTGHLDLLLTHEQTRLMPPNLAIGTVIDDDTLQARTRQTTDYDWDLEIIYPGDVVESPYKGVIVVYPEVRG